MSDEESEDKNIGSLLGDIEEGKVLWPFVS